MIKLLQVPRYGTVITNLSTQKQFDKTLNFAKLNDLIPLNLKTLTSSDLSSALTNYKANYIFNNI